MFKRIVFLVICLSVSSAAMADQANNVRLAPADEYFGRLKMSVLGIQNVIRDMRLRVQSDPTRTESIFGSLAMVEDSIHDWESKYPQDNWIAKDLLALEITYLTAGGERAHSCAVHVEGWLRERYSGSQYAERAHDELLGAEAR
jgi:hypothetical protein